MDYCISDIHGYYDPFCRLPDKIGILLYPRGGTAKDGRSIADYCKVHLNTGVVLSGVLGCFAVNNGQCFYVIEQ